MTYNTAAPAIPPSTWAINVRADSFCGKRSPATSPTETAGFKWQPGDMADGIGHRQHRQPEGERHSEEADTDIDRNALQLRAHDRCEDSTPASAKD